MKLWRPNRLQWVVLWGTYFVAGHVWLGLDLTDFLWNNRYDRQGLVGYLLPAVYNQKGHLALLVVIMGLLLLWQFAGYEAGTLSASLRRIQNWLLPWKRWLIRLTIAVGVVAVFGLVIWLASLTPQAAPPAAEAIGTVSAPAPSVQFRPEEILAVEERPLPTDKATALRPTPDELLDQFLKGTQPPAKSQQATPKSFEPDPPSEPAGAAKDREKKREP